jgi:predicted Fe-S protein YdhL (DUF1289 family)
MESPCTKVCTLDEEGRICLGCRRTVDEIVAWGSLTDAQRARIMGELPRRRLPGEPAGDPPRPQSR